MWHDFEVYKMGYRSLYYVLLPAEIVYIHKEMYEYLNMSKQNNLYTAKKE